jgi:hypothetical protein
MNTDNITRLQYIVSNPNATLMNMCEVLSNYFLVSQNLYIHPNWIIDHFKNDHGKAVLNEAEHYMNVVKEYRAIRGFYI